MNSHSLPSQIFQTEINEKMYFYVKRFLKETIPRVGQFAS